jgi:imidazole glycerol-phosphate synthase subunit HisH
VKSVQLPVVRVYTSESMAMTEVTVIDYGVGNLLSVSRAFEHCGAKVTITADPKSILSAGRVVLPGVGAFADGMAALKAFGLDAVVREVAARRTPLLGICLGMQLLFDESEEFGVTDGLGLIPGRVVNIPSMTTTGESQKIPHIGWNELVLPRDNKSWPAGLLTDITPSEAVYFVHSFMAVPASNSHRLADCVYGGIQIAAAVRRENVVGCQFHPEKSGAVGMKILRRFISQ